MNRTTRLKKPQIPELDTLYQFDDLGGRPKYGGVEMTSETDIPSFQEIMDETHSAVVAEATARDDADEALEIEIQELARQTSEALDNEATARANADTAIRGALNSEASTRGAADVALQNQIDAIVASSDVKDIVGTYAALQQYDTSTLGDRDIIKVLQDETHQNETTYYRWSTSTSTFTLIGEEGPYYTKAATDALLNDKADKATTYTKTEVDDTVDDLEDAIAAKQDQLTAGSNINIDANNVISGTYTHFTGATASTDGVQGLVPGPLAGDEDKFLKADGTWGAVQAGPTVVQTAGDSTTDVMSQNATTSMVFADPTVKRKIKIGQDASTDGNNTVAIGYYAYTKRDGNVAIGSNASAHGNNAIVIGSDSGAYGNGTTVIGKSAYTQSNHLGSVALGAYSGTSSTGEVNIGTSITSYGYNNSNYRLLTGLYDPQSAHDAATKGYVDTAVAGAGASYYSNSELESLWEGGV